MDEYKDFSVEDFLQDEFFRLWVKNPVSKDAELWDRWLSANGDMREVVDQAKNIILAFEHQPKLLPDEFFTNLKSRIDDTINHEREKGTTPFFKGRWLKMVAILAGLILGGGILFKLATTQTSLTYSSKYGETRKVELPDGSEVTLNANSVIKYQYDSTNNRREVWLKGQGFFNIKPAKSARGIALKFIVHTKDIQVEVLGTEFTVNDSETGKTAVLLTKGSIRLSVAEGYRQLLNMTADELVEYSNKTKQISVQKVSPANYIAWVEHKYIFEKATLENVAKELYHYYGKQIIIEDPAMRKKRLSGTLELQDEDVLIETLSVLLGVKVYKNDNQIIIWSE